MTATAPASLARQLLAILDKDEDRLGRIDRYLKGDHDDPYMPDLASAEYRLLAKRCVSNWMPLLVGTPAQALYVDGFRRGAAANGDVAPGSTAFKREIGAGDSEWDHWQQSRLDARQTAIYRGALTFGHAFTLTEKSHGKVHTKGLSARTTAAVFEDAANDMVPYAALNITRQPTTHAVGKARMWDNDNEYVVTFKTLLDKDAITVREIGSHGASECPVTRFTATVDLEGRTIGVIEPLIAIADRINQTTFDLLVAQTYASFKVRTATGMAPPMRMKPVKDEAGNPTGESVLDLDENGMPTPADINVNASRFLFAEDSEVKFGSLDETPLGGFIESIDMSIRHLSAISQTPPHYLLGQIANLSAEALQAAETSLARKTLEFRQSFGESWERVFRLAAEMADDMEAANDFHGEVLWRDMESRSLAASADALAKLKDLGIPVRGLMRRVPGVTQTELTTWEDMMDQEPAVAISNALRRATPSAQPATPAVAA